VNTLLTELDGLNDRRGVYVVGATNRPDIIDPAMIRPGRLDNPLFVALPTASERVEILITLTKKTPLSADVDLKLIAEDPRARNFRYINFQNDINNSGADLSALVRQAAILSLKKTLLVKGPAEEESRRVDITVGMENFEEALNSVRPSVSDQDRRRYEQLRTVFDIVR
jgi:ribosome biogenesis ATPase